MPGRKQGRKAREQNEKDRLSSQERQPRTRSRSPTNTAGYALLGTPPSASRLGVGLAQNSSSPPRSKRESPRTAKINKARARKSVKPRVYKGGKSPRRAPLRRTNSVRPRTRKRRASLGRAKSVGHKSRTPSFTVGSRVASFGSLPKSLSF